MIRQSWELLINSISFSVNTIRPLIHYSGMIFKNMIRGWLSPQHTYFFSFYLFSKFPIKKEKVWVTWKTYI